MKEGVPANADRGIPIDLRQFCSTDKHRPALHHPWTRDGFTWATNGRVLVRVPERKDVPENPAAPSAERVLAQVSLEDPFTPLPLVTLPAQADAEECEKCGGSGQADHDCPSCDCLCDECDGDGFFQPKQSTRIAGSVVDLFYVRQIYALPAIAVGRPKDEKAPIPFTFADDGILLLMPMCGTHPEHFDDLFSGVGDAASNQKAALAGIIPSQEDSK